MRILAIDVGGTRIKYGVVDESNEIQRRGEVETPREEEGFVREMKEIIERSGEVEGIGIAIPGVVDSVRGKVIESEALGFLERMDIEERLGVRGIVIENDANCAGIAEVEHGELRGYERGIVIVIGTSIGSAIIERGEVLRGERNRAGEIAYMMESEEEEYFRGGAGAIGMIRRYEEAKGLEAGSVDGFYFFEKIREGEEEAERIMSEYIGRLGVMIVNMVMVLDVRRVLIGGGISRQEEFIRRLRERIGKMRRVNGRIAEIELRACRFYNEANLVGAAALCKRRKILR